MFELIINHLERLAKIQPQLTILILMIVVFDNKILNFINNFLGVLQ